MKIVYSPTAGETIEYATKEAWRLSVRSGQDVCFNFNGIAIQVQPHSMIAETVGAFFSENRRRAEEYRNSPEGKAASVARESEIASKDKRLNVMVADLPSTLRLGTTRTMDWLAEYAFLADDIGVDGDYKEVIQLLQKAGYSEDDSSFDYEKTTITPDVMAKYIAGNAINCMKGNLPPHPAMTRKFVDEYKICIAKG